MACRLVICFIAGLLFFPYSSFAEQVRGLWVECEGTNNTLSSPHKLQKMLVCAKETGINTIFLQVYRHNRSWFNSNLSENSPYNIFWNKYKIDPLYYTISHAHKYGIRVHAWVNIFRIGRDLDIPLIQKLGKDVITRDGRGKSLVQYPVDKLPDGGYWLDPGDLNVQDYLLKVITEILQKYPGLDGIHLDFVRYPYIDLNPGSQFSDRKDFGYGKNSVERFMAKYGYSPLEMDLKDRERTLQWDNWRREQVGDFTAKVYKLCKGTNPLIQVSCAVQPWTDRAYLVAYQDWRSWLENKIVDFLVIMNYSVDNKLFKYLSSEAITASPSIYIGLGAYLVLNSPDKLYMQIKICQNLKARGIVLFSYDAMLKNKKILKDIEQNRWWIN